MTAYIECPKCGKKHQFVMSGEVQVYEIKCECDEHMIVRAEIHRNIETEIFRFYKKTGTISASVQQPLVQKEQKKEKPLHIEHKEKLTDSEIMQEILKKDTEETKKHASFSSTEIYKLNQNSRGNYLIEGKARDFINRLKERKNLACADIEHKAGLRAQQYQNWVKGLGLPSQSIQRIGKVLGFEFVSGEIVYAPKKKKEDAA